MSVAGGVALFGVSIAGARQVYQASDDTAPIIAVDPATLSPEEASDRVRQMQKQMAKTEARVAALQKRAEAKRDMVMINCTADKLVQVRGYLAVGNQAVQSVDLSIQKHDDGARNHNYERTNIVYQKVLILGTEAEGCAGEDVSYVGATRVDVDVDPSIPVTDPTIPEASIPPTVSRPPDATPFA